MSIISFITWRLMEGYNVLNSQGFLVCIHMLLPRIIQSKCWHDLPNPAVLCMGHWKVQGWKDLCCLVQAGSPPRHVANSFVTFLQPPRIYLGFSCNPLYWGRPCLSILPFPELFKRNSFLDLGECRLLHSWEIGFCKQRVTTQQLLTPRTLGPASVPRNLAPPPIVVFSATVSDF